MCNTFEPGTLHLTIVIMEVPGRLPKRGWQLQLWPLCELREESRGGELKRESSLKIDLSISGGALCSLVSDQTTCSDDHCEPAQRNVPRGDCQPRPPTLWRRLWELQEAPQTNPCLLGEDSDYKEKIELTSINIFQVDQIRYDNIGNLLHYAVTWNQTGYLQILLDHGLVVNHNSNFWRERKWTKYFMGASFGVAPLPSVQIWFLQRQS